MRVLRALAVAGVLVAAGCGGDDDSGPPASESPKVEIANTVNDFFAAWTAGDGETACSLVSPRGERLVSVIAPQDHSLSAPIDRHLDCVTAIQQSAEASTGEIGQHAVPSQVRLDGPNRAAVLSKFRGEMAVVKVDGTWLIEVPAFID